MTRNLRFLLIGGTAMLAAACSEKLTSAFDSQLLNAAFNTTPLGFDNAVSSYNGTGSDSSHAFMPGEHGGPRGGNGLDGGHDFMGGGFGMDFLGGGLGGGRPFDRGGFGSHGTCTYSASTGVNSCTDTHNGITINSTVKYTNAAGGAQAAPDSTTDKVVAHVDVAGTHTFSGRGGASISTTVSSSSDRTVTGLAYNSTQRTVNGASKGSESTTGSDSAGSFTIARAIGDTTKGVIIPIASGKPTYPTAGTVIRQMSGAITRGTAAPTTTSRREVITYDGTATAKLVITHDGTTKNCTIALPRGRPVCS